MIAANLFVGRPWGSAAITVLGAFTVGLVALFGALDMLGGQVLSSDYSPQTRFAIDAGQIVTAAAAAGFLLRPIRRDLAMFLPIDPDHPVHTIALVLAALLLGTQVTAIAFTDVLASNLDQPPLGIPDLLASQLPFLILAVTGVGIFIRRKPGASAERLGLVRPAWWHLVLALAAAGAFIGLGQASDFLSQALTPDLARRVASTTTHVFAGLNNPLGIAAIAILPGICEEVLFRGALQPRLGLLATAVLFTSVHTEYGLSFDTLAVFILALALGLIRKYTNTTTSSVCHASYNLLVGIGIGGAFINAAVVAEAALVAISAYAILVERRRRAGTPPP